MEKQNTTKKLKLSKNVKSKKTNQEANLRPSLVMSILEIKLLKTFNLAKDSQRSNVVSRAPNFPADKSKELLSQELSSESQEFFFLTKLPLL